MMRGSRQPAWWLLYLVPFVLVGLWLVQERARLSPLGHRVIQAGITVFIYALVWRWVSWNAEPLTLAGRSRRPDSGRADPTHPRGVPPVLAMIPRRWTPPTRWGNYALALVVVTASTLASWGVAPFVGPEDIVMLYLVGVLAAASRLGRGPAVVTSFLSVLAFDFFFVHPTFTFVVSDSRYVLTFAVMLGAALLVSTLTSRLQAQIAIARDREGRSAAMVDLSRDLVALSDAVALCDATARHVSGVVGGAAMVLLPDAAGSLAPASSDSGDPLTVRERDVAEWVHRSGQPAGQGTAFEPDARAGFVPLTGPRGPVGVLVVRFRDAARSREPGQRDLLQAMANQAALAIERTALASESEKARLQAERESMRSSLLSSASHDLRTPLAGIVGAASTMVERGDDLDAATIKLLSQSISDEAARLNHLVASLLDMTRLQLGPTAIKKEWVAVEEVVGSALHRAEGVAGHPVVTDLPEELPLVACDEVLLEQALINVLENAAKYTPEGSEITVAVRQGPGELVVEVADRGPGWPKGEEDLVFEKFHRGPKSGRGGFGLGLAIAKAIVEAQGGWIKAEPREGGGALLRFSVPLDGAPPAPDGNARGDGQA